MHFHIIKTTEIMTTDEQYMRKALAEAEQAAREGEVPIGAVVVCREQMQQFFKTKR